MKTINVFLMLFISIQLLGQSKGYYGTSIGTSIPISQFSEKAKIGVTFNALNFGYYFTDHIGISGLWLLSNHNPKIQGFTNAITAGKWIYSSFSLGIFANYPINKFNINFHLLPSFIYSTYPETQKILYIQNSANATNFSIIPQLELLYNIISNLNLNLYINYLHINPKFNLLTYKSNNFIYKTYLQSIYSINIRLGFTINLSNIP